ncbi:DUF4054 domain-containing protein [Testudinibacter sp. P80/BLE/0925]
MNTATFRIMFPAFFDPNKYSDEMLNQWGDVAGNYLRESWALNGGVFDHAYQLMTAHLLFVTDKARSGNASSGAVQSATEGSVSVSFAAPPTRNGWEFWLSGSPYGAQLWALLSSLSAGGLYIGGLPERKAVRKVGGVFL